MEDINRPSPMIDNKKANNPRYKRAKEPIKGTPKNVVAAKNITLASIILMINGGMVLPKINTVGEIGETKICSNVPSSLSLAMERDVSIKAMIIDKVPMRFGTIHQKLSKLGLYQFLFTMMSFDG